jgi:hypothetical protein
MESGLKLATMLRERKSAKGKPRCIHNRVMCTRRFHSFYIDSLRDLLHTKYKSSTRAKKRRRDEKQYLSDTSTKEEDDTTVNTQQRQLSIIPTEVQAMQCK